MGLRGRKRRKRNIIRIFLRVFIRNEGKKRNRGRK
jgi:hypothetical protein